MKKTIMYVITSLFAFCFCGLVNATEVSEPVLEGNVLYANGTAITISARNDEVAGAKITWGTSGTMNVPADTIIFGGGKVETSYASSNITMTGGTVSNLYGGGRGTTTLSADVTTATITISGGVISNTVYGGGYLASKVTNASISMTNGTALYVMGGGRANGNKVLDPTNYGSLSAGTKDAIKESKCVVDNAVVSISGGKASYVYGGGSAYAYVKNATVNISGTASIKYDAENYGYLSGTGSNGRVDSATINVSGTPAIDVMQSINRGSINNAKINISGGTIAFLYAGGENPETYPGDVVDGTLDEDGKIVVDITGGEITSFTPGANNGIVIAKDADFLSVMYNADKVGNVANIEKLFGESAKPYTSENLIVEANDEPIIVHEQTLYGLQETGNEYLYVNEEAGYQWNINGTDITDPTIELDTEITMTVTAPSDIADDINKLVPANTKTLFVDFSHEGVLPGKATVKVIVADLFEDGTKVYVTHYNETTKKLELVAEPVVTNGLIEFDITSCSTYLVNTTNLIPNPKTSDSIMIYVTILSISLMGLYLTSKLKKVN